VANQDLRFRRRVVTTVVEPQPKNKLMMMLTVAVAAVIVPALIYTAMHPASVSSTVNKIAKHLPLPTKDIRIAIVASRVTPTPQPSATPAASPTPKATKAATPATAVEQAHLAHLKRAHALALAAAHAKRLASNGQTSDTAGGGADNAGSTDAASTGAAGATTGSTAGTTTTTAATPAAVAAAGQTQPVVDATPVYAPDIIVEARFTHEAKPDYPDVAKEQNAQGTAVVLATIGPNGNVISAHIDQSTGNKLLDGAALTAARDSGFEPPKINGKPATETYRLVYTFAL
jgi:TonB family protein